MRWIQSLPSCPLDVIGDVHGEIDALNLQLAALGYDSGQAQAQGRKLVFVGDLVDRGPDSLAVLRRVRGLVEEGAALVVLGNHELNLLRWERKSGNHWFYGADEVIRDGILYDSVKADRAERQEILGFLAAQPLALERSDLRIVHACWHPPSIEALRIAPNVPIGDLVDQWDTLIHTRLQEAGVPKRAEQERAPYDLRDPDYTPPLLQWTAEEELARQTGNPVRVLTSGLEQLAERPFFAAGRWRMLRRVPWWEDYIGPLVVVGHYWRRSPRMPPLQRHGGIFDGDEPFRAMGRGDVYCVDFSVGRRYFERLGGAPPFKGQLGALRCPAEGQDGPWEVFLDDEAHPVRMRRR